MALHILLLLLIAIQAISADDIPPRIGSLDEEWSKFKVQYNKVYKNPEEETKRKEIFSKNLDFIKEVNKKYDAYQTSFALGVSATTDKVFDEIVMK
ncbi:unnamed protein product [Hermetia illucens]|uniref:Cathepsin propeptide inhibitor domain-containing protein n=1 Tax=Hermetia illucens TaxID=343691 RepID=A0A7R8UTH0_HERIL|nr:crustapain-like [Hermetia illucens]CAD7086712.1 unnamed protein product [Hermetia illucens]